MRFHDWETYERSDFYTGAIICHRCGSVMWSEHGTNPNIGEYSDANVSVDCDEVILSQVHRS